jgi:hypothetical protein
MGASVVAVKNMLGDLANAKNISDQFNAMAKEVMKPAAALEKLRQDMIDLVQGKGIPTPSAKAVGGAGNFGANFVDKEKAKKELKEPYILTQADVDGIVEDLDKANKEIMVGDMESISAEAREYLSSAKQEKDYHKAMLAEKDLFVINSQLIDQKYQKGTVKWQAEMKKEEARDLQERNKIYQDSIRQRMQLTDMMVRNLSSGVSDMIGALVGGEKNMGKAAGKMFGNMANSAGQFFMAEGLAKVAQGGWPPNPLALSAGWGEIYAGTALTALGGILGAASGSASSSASRGGSGGGNSSSGHEKGQGGKPFHQTQIMVTTGNKAVDTFIQSITRPLINSLNEQFRDNAHMEFAGGM